MSAIQCCTHFDLLPLYIHSSVILPYVVAWYPGTTTMLQQAQCSQLQWVFAATPCPRLVCLWHTLRLWQQPTAMAVVSPSLQFARLFALAAAASTAVSVPLTPGGV